MSPKGKWIAESRAMVLFMVSCILPEVKGAASQCTWHCLHPADLSVAKLMRQHAQAFGGSIRGIDLDHGV